MGKTILTVDDASTMRMLVAYTLKSAGHTVVEDEDGLAGLSVLGNTQVDLVISDVNMPKMDGIEMVRNARKLPSCKFTPILMLTTESEGSIKAKAKEAGATGWLVKPFQPEQLLAAVSKVLGV